MKLRLPDEVLESGDLGVHDEEAYPDESLITASGRADWPKAPRAAKPDSEPAEPVDD
jgi:Amt family ammonium transporter